MICSALPFSVAVIRLDIFLVVKPTHKPIHQQDILGSRSLHIQAIHSGLLCRWQACCLLHTRYLDSATERTRLYSSALPSTVQARGLKKMPLSDHRVAQRTWQRSFYTKMFISNVISREPWTCQPINLPDGASRSEEVVKVQEDGLMLNKEFPH